jgi:hypothetical protein
MYRLQSRGMSFMDVMVGTALVLLIFTALTGLLQTSLKVSQLAKTRSIATAVAESQMEYIRSLQYDAVGTVGGIPAGLIPQNATSTQNGIEFGVRTFIQYVDDPADGTGAADATGIITDYKRIKVTVSYTANTQPQTVSLVSSYSPPGLETTTGGGTLRISVVNATGAAVPGASVRIVNNSLAPTIDLTAFSDVTGTVFLPGAPTSTDYQVEVSKTGYSSAQTYVRDATNQNPTPGYLTVAENQTTTGTFAIDLLSSLTIRTYYPIATSTWSDTFTSTANIAAQTGTTVVGGSVELLSDINGYAPSGTVVGEEISPTYLANWGVATATTTVPGGTTLRFHVVDGNGTQLPDTALPGNSGGFTGSVDLYGVSTTTYPTLALAAELSTSATSTTPTLDSWSLSYARGPIPVPSVPFILRGAKTIGSTGAGLPLYKTSVAETTDSTGGIDLDLEWDVYTLSLTSYNVVSACNPPPYTLAPGSTNQSSLYLATSTTNMLLVSVRDTAGAVPGAAVTITGPTDDTVMTDACGSAYFGGIGSGSYSIGVSKAGYTTFNASSVPVSSHVFYPVSLD